MRIKHLSKTPFWTVLMVMMRKQTGFELGSLVCDHVRQLKEHDSVLEAKCPLLLALSMVHLYRPKIQYQYIVISQ